VPSGYDYGNARLRAMRSRLFQAADYQNLLNKGSIEEVITALTETPYKEDIELALTRLAGVPCILKRFALTHRTLRQIRTFFEGEPLWAGRPAAAALGPAQPVDHLRAQSREIARKQL